MTERQETDNVLRLGIEGPSCGLVDTREADVFCTIRTQAESLGGVGSTDSTDC